MLLELLGSPIWDRLNCLRSGLQAVVVLLRIWTEAAMISLHLKRDLLPSSTAQAELLLPIYKLYKTPSFPHWFLLSSDIFPPSSLPG
jgi:hypothetical protein